MRQEKSQRAGSLADKQILDSPKTQKVFNQMKKYMFQERFIHCV